MPEPLGWARTEPTGEGFLSVLIVRHPPSVSFEGVLEQRNRAEKALADPEVDLQLVGAISGRGDAGAEALKILMGAWDGSRGGDDAGS